MIENRTDKENKNLLNILLYGYGNPGRQDDALGVILVEKMAAWAKSNGYWCITTDQNYQLNIEDAEYISKYDLVVFLDASVGNIESVKIEPVIPDLKTEFSMHSVSPSFVVGLSKEMFHRIPEVFQLHIKGYRFRFMKPPTKKALKNLELASEKLKTFLLKYLPAENK